MQTVPVSLQINMSGITRIPGLTGQLHLKGKRQILLNIWVCQIRDVPIGPGSAQPVKKHDLCRRLSGDLRNQMGRIRHTIPMQIDCDLD